MVVLVVVGGSPITDPELTTFLSFSLLREGHKNLFINAKNFFLLLTTYDNF